MWNSIFFIYQQKSLFCCCCSLIKAGNKPSSTTTPGKPKKATTFQEFESITSDAWDVGDDDDELLAMAAQNLNIEVVMETANKVIENHSKLQERRQQQMDKMTEPDEKDGEEAHEVEEEEPEEEEEREEGAETTTDLSFSSEALPLSDNRLVKSHSEAPVGSPKGQSNIRTTAFPVSVYSFSLVYCLAGCSVLIKLTLILLCYCKLKQIKNVFGNWIK